MADIGCLSYYMATTGQRYLVSILLFDSDSLGCLVLKLVTRLIAVPYGYVSLDGDCTYSIVENTTTDDLSPVIQTPGYVLTNNEGGTAPATCDTQADETPICLRIRKKWDPVC